MTAPAVTSARSAATEVTAALNELLDGFDPTDLTEGAAQAFLGRQFDLGLAWVRFDRGFGGLGLPSATQAVVDARLRTANAPSAFSRNPLGVGMVGPALHDHADDSQRARLLRPLFQGIEIWCQLFSEPGAGSDLASAATRAERDGNAWVINGQKVWTSFAHKARRGLLLARTSTDTKHGGLTTFALDMQAPGVEVRPLYQMTGDAEFNEIFLTDVRIPDTDRLDQVGNGWSVILTTLANERVAIGDQARQRGSGIIGSALRVWDEASHHSPAKRDRLAQLWIRAEVLRLLNLRLSDTRGEGAPGPEGSMSKILSSRLNQDIAGFEMDLLGAAGTLKPSGYAMARSERDALDYGDVVYDFLRAQANSIEGGTSDIGRNVLAERLLGLPRQR